MCTCSVAVQHGEMRADVVSPGVPKERSTEAECRVGGEEGAANSNGAQPVEESAQGRGEDAGALHPALWREHDRQMQLEAFRCIYGSAVSRELIPVEARLSGGDGATCSLAGKGEEGAGSLEAETRPASSGAPVLFPSLREERSQDWHEQPRGIKALFSMRALISSANYSAKKTTFILFINGMPTCPTTPLLALCALRLLPRSGAGMQD